MPRRRLTSAVLEGRGKNAAAELLSKKLILPKIFFEAHWPTNGDAVDVLAIDRSGTGSVHVVEVSSSADAKRTIRRLLETPAHFKYLALFRMRPFFDWSEPHPSLYARDGMGRIGVISLYEGDPGDALGADIVVEPERFRVPESIYKDVDRFLSKHSPDIAVRT